MGPLQFVATAFSALGALSSASAQRNASEYNAAAAERNAGIARQQAAADAALQQRRARQHLGTMRTQIAKSGVMLEGSPLDVLEQSAAEAEMDKLTTIYKGELRAIGFDDTAGLNRSQAAGAAGTALYGVGKAILLGTNSGTGIFSDEEEKPTKLKMR